MIVRVSNCVGKTIPFFGGRSSVVSLSVEAEDTNRSADLDFVQNGQVVDSIANRVSRQLLVVIR